MWYNLRMTIASTGQVFTVAEIAKVLRVSDETIRRKIVAGELEAIEVSSTPRKTYRIPEYALVRWLGAEKAKQLFGVRHGFEEFRELLLKIPEHERTELLEEAVAWARAQRPEPELTRRTVTKEQIAERFKK
jgi:excisionase family DNA binding protein